MSGKPKIKAFQATSDDLDSLHDQIAEWLTTNVVPLNYNHTVHFHVKDKKWYILLLVMYQDISSSQIAVPSFKGAIPFSPN